MSPEEKAIGDAVVRVMQQVDRVIACVDGQAPIREGGPNALILLVTALEELRLARDSLAELGERAALKVKP